MSRPRNHRLHNLELKTMIASHENKAHVATTKAVGVSAFWHPRRHREACDEATKHQAIADALRHAMAGGRQ